MCCGGRGGHIIFPWEDTGRGDDSGGRATRGQVLRVSDRGGTRGVRRGLRAGGLRGGGEDHRGGCGLGQFVRPHLGERRGQQEGPRRRGAAPRQDRRGGGADGRG